MHRTYLTVIPLQGSHDLEQVTYARDGSAPPQATRFPIVQVIRDTLASGDTAQVLAIRQENDDTTRNEQLLLEELAGLGIPETSVTRLTLPENQNPGTLVQLCRDVADVLPQVTRVYACITYGTKSIPVVTLAALTCAEATHTELEVGGIYYGEIRRQNGRTVSARLNDVTMLYQLSGLVGGIRDSKTAEAVFRQLIWMNEHREG